jgi:hypothetical protein
MRKILIVLPLLLGASPALAQPVPPPEPIQLPRELTDPATAERLANSVQVLTEALLNVKVGGVRAALEGREAGPRERNLTVGDLARRRDPNFDRDIRRQVASVEPKVRRGMKAVNEALPQIMQGVTRAEQAIDRVAANMPDPTYPNR